MREHGLVVYRGTQRGRVHRARNLKEDSALIRAGRLADLYLGGSGPLTVPWSVIPQERGLYNVPATPT